MSSEAQTLKKVAKKEATAAAAAKKSAAAAKRDSSAAKELLHVLEGGSTKKQPSKPLNDKKQGEMSKVANMLPPPDLVMIHWRGEDSRLHEVGRFSSKEFEAYGDLIGFVDKVLRRKFGDVDFEIRVAAEPGSEEEWAFHALLPGKKQPQGDQETGMVGLVEKLLHDQREIYDAALKQGKSAPDPVENFRQMLTLFQQGKGGGGGVDLTTLMMMPMVMDMMKEQSRDKPLSSSVESMLVEMAKRIDAKETKEFVLPPAPVLPAIESESQTELLDAVLKFAEVMKPKDEGIGQQQMMESIRREGERSIEMLKSQQADAEKRQSMMMEHQRAMMELAMQNQNKESETSLLMKKIGPLLAPFIPALPGLLARLSGENVARAELRAKERELAVLERERVAAINQPQATLLDQLQSLHATNEALERIGIGSRRNEAKADPAFWPALIQGLVQPLIEQLPTILHHTTEAINAAKAPGPVSYGPGRTPRPSVPQQRGGEPDPGPPPAPKKRAVKLPPAALAALPLLQAAEGSAQSLSAAFKLLDGMAEDDYWSRLLGMLYRFAASGADTRVLKAVEVFLTQLEGAGLIGNAVAIKVYEAFDENIEYVMEELSKRTVAAPTADDSPV